MLHIYKLMTVHFCIACSLFLSPTGLNQEQLTMTCQTKEIKALNTEDK